MFWKKMRKIFGAVLVLSCIAAAMLMILSAKMFGIASVIVCVGLAGFFGVLAGILFTKIFLQDISESFTGLLLFPLRFLEEPPFETGAVYALMRGPDPAKAEVYLNGLPPEKRLRPEAVLAKIELYRDILKRPEAALQAAEEYLLLPRRRRSTCGKAILMAYADLAPDAGKTDLLTETLKRELKRPIYTETEKKEIHLRLASMTNQSGS